MYDFLFTAFVLPAQNDLTQKAFSTTKVILDTAKDAAGGLSAIGKGIASIFLLFVIFYYISAMLDGGKFQTKMLWPFLVYVMVCNFNFFSSPVISFATTLQRECASLCYEKTNTIKSSLSESHSGKTSMWQIFIEHARLENQKTGAEEADDMAIEIVEEVTETSGGGSSSDGGGEGSSSTETKKTTKLSGLGAGLTKALSDFWQNTVIGMFSSFSVGFQKGVSTVSIYMKYGLLGILASIIQLVCSAASLMMIFFGGVMMAVVIAFGPVTLAFAVFPGNGKVIGTWCIRLCQFALYSPIVFLIDTFNMALFQAMLKADMHILLLIAILICNIALLFSVPGIASMIIEGASGAVSLSQGLNSASQWGSSAMKIAASPGRGILAVSRLGAILGEPKRDSQQLEVLKSINEAVGGSSQNGMNSKKKGK